MKSWRRILLTAAVLWSPTIDAALALNGGTLRVNPRNGWRAFEVISTGDNPADAYPYTLPGTFDGVGAWLPDATTLRLEVNHETSDASVSEVNLDRASFQTAIRNVINGGTTGGVSFVTSAQQAYGRWSSNAGATWSATSDTSTTSFRRFCSGQSYRPSTFGAGRGFVDNIYITGEEVDASRLFAIDLANRDFYQLSGVTGSALGGIGGMPFDSWENAALLDTGETNYVALLLSPDGGSQILQLYVGEKGKDVVGNPSTSFLARNGLAYGSYYYLNGTLPASGTSTDGFFDTTAIGGLFSTKLEDVDANPNDSTQFVLGDQDSGLFTFDLHLDFSSGSFNAAGSNFSVTMIQNHNNDIDGLFGDADNVDWTAPTTLGGVTYPNGLIFVNEDSATANGETWMMTHTGSALTNIADTAPSDGATTETSGILDISTLVGYKPGSILVTTNQGNASSLTALINTSAALLAAPLGDFNGNGVVDGADYVVWRNGLGPTYTKAQYDLWRSQFGHSPSNAAAATLGDFPAIPEPTSLSILAWGVSLVAEKKVFCRRE
jgi:hypothetical protein